LASAIEEMRQKNKAITTALKKSQQEFQTLFESVPCYISVQDRDFRLLRVNRDFRKDFGEKIGDHCYEVYKGRKDKCPNCKVEKTFQTGLIYSGEETVTNKQGETADILVYTTPIFNEHNEIVSVMELSVNITILKALEEELSKSEEAYRLLFNNDPSPIFVVERATFKILDGNIRALDLYRYSKTELMDKTFFDLVPEEAHPELKIFFLKNQVFLEKIKQVRKDGMVFFVNLRASQGVYLDTPVFIITANDITERIQTEQQLAQTSKMATLGELSAGVAHELNQPLTVIKTGSNFILRKVRDKQPISEEDLTTLAKEMDAQVDRASRIINHLREFGRKTEIHKSAIQVNEAITGMLTVIGKQLELRKIKVVLDLDAELPRILGDKNRLEQVFLNLSMNARDALEEKEGADKVIRIRSFFESPWVTIEFFDNGCGIPAEIQEKIFEPFFSTKGVGQGTGLGLSISYGIIRDYQGQIKVASRKGEGTTFTLLFPPLDKEKDLSQ
jgi:histidine kinase